jgi:hypothetical protein
LELNGTPWLLVGADCVNGQEYAIKKSAEASLVVNKVVFLEVNPE